MRKRADYKRFGMMLTAVLAAVFSAYASSPEETIDSIHSQLTLQEVEVMAERSETYSKTYRMVSRIEREEITALPVQTVADIIKYCAGVDVRTRGASGAQADISMRGGTFDQVVVLLNGVNITDAQTGHYSLNLPVSVDLIERVEVLQGTSAHLFGLNALAGAINIVTRREPNAPSDATLRLTTGMNALVNPAAATHLRWDDTYLNASVEYTRSDGYYAPSPSAKEKTALDNSDLRLVNIFVQTGYKGLDIQLGTQYKDAGAGMFYGFGSQDQFDATRTAFGAARYARQWDRWQLEAAASYRANYDRYEWHRGHRQYGNFHFTQYAAASVKGGYVSKIGVTTLGVEVRNENIHSTNLGDTVNPAGQVPNVEGFPLSEVRVLDLVMGKNRLNLNYFAEQTFFWRGLSAALGISGNYNTMFAHNMAGTANVAYAFNPHAVVYVNANRSLRLPTFTDLYYNAGNQLGNRDLKPEEAWALSLGAKYTKSLGEHGMLNASAEGFYRWGKNVIDWVYTPSDTKRPYHAQNHQEVNAAGAEATVSYRRERWLRNLQLSYAYTWLDLDLTNAGSRYLDYLSHKLVVCVDHDIWRFRHTSSLSHQTSVLGASWALTWQKREGQFNTADGDVANFKPVLLLDGQIFWEYNGIKVAAECTNMTNRHYYDYGGVLQPGAWAKLTISANLASLARSLK